MRTRRKRRSPYRLIQYLIVGVLFLMLPLLIKEGIKYGNAVREYNSLPQMSQIPATADLPVFQKSSDQWPEDRLFLEKNRADYQSGQLRLIIPKMGVNDLVMDGTEPSALKEGPGLYTVAQMPGSGSQSNTSIAGHRSGYGRYGNLFYYIDQMTEGDLFYLQDEQWIYTYVYQDTKITTPEDTSVLLIKDFSCLTLTSCHPLGSNTQRIVVTARLSKVEPFKENFIYAEKEGEIK